jgi:hypothetical protein
MRTNKYNNFSGKRVFIKSLVITIFLFLILSEIASAANLVMITDPAQPVAGQPVTLTFQLTPTTTQYDMSGNIEIEIYQNGNSICPQHTVEVPFSGIVSDTFTPLTAGQYEAYISYLSLPNDKEDDSFRNNFNVINGGSIPEFPSIAVPVVAVLGIIIICGRRKL